jgi:hypothetical protein
MAKRPHLLLQAGSRATHQQIAVSGIPMHPNYGVIFKAHTWFNKCGSGLHITGWQAAGWMPML